MMRANTSHKTVLRESTGHQGSAQPICERALKLKAIKAVFTQDNIKSREHIGAGNFCVQRVEDAGLIQKYHVTFDHGSDQYYVSITVGDTINFSHGELPDGRSFSCLCKDTYDQKSSARKKEMLRALSAQRSKHAWLKYLIMLLLSIIPYGLALAMHSATNLLFVISLPEIVTTTIISSSVLLLVNLLLSIGSKNMTFSNCVPQVVCLIGIDLIFVYYAHFANITQASFPALFLIATCFVFNVIVLRLSLDFEEDSGSDIAEGPYIGTEKGGLSSSALSDNGDTKHQGVSKIRRHKAVAATKEERDDTDIRASKEPR